MKRVMFVLFGLMIAMGVGVGDSQAKSFHADISGSGVDSAVDPNGDGSPANHNIGGGQGSFGQFTINGLSDAALRGFPEPYPSPPYPRPENCPQNSFEFEYTTHSSVYRFANGDLLFTERSEDDYSYGCLELGADIGVAVQHDNVIGGTGRFEGARGSMIIEAVGLTLLKADSPTAPIVFQAWWGTVTGTVE